MVEHYHEDPAYLEDGVEQLFTLLDDDVAKSLVVQLASECKP